MEIVPDTKDWTWVLERACAECGFDAADVEPADLPHELRTNAGAWAAVLGRPDVGRRPSPDVWSPLEYGCHVRDVHRTMQGRVALMLEQDAPTFANWDQDETALASDYAAQDPATVDVELVEAAGTVAGLYATVTPETAGRTGTRSNGSVFTVTTLGRYHLHDVVHHLHDVSPDPRAATIRAYDEHAAAYREATVGAGAELRAALDSFAARLGPGASVLEIGSAGGRDAAALEAAGLRVRRTDVTPAFVSLLRAAGHSADVVDPLTDDLGAAASYDGVWASACLLHVERADVPTVLRRLGEVTRAGGVLHVSLKEGDGEGWSSHGSVSAPRRFVYWREEPLRAALEEAGWTVESVVRSVGHRDTTWLTATAVCAR